MDEATLRAKVLEHFEDYVVAWPHDTGEDPEDPEEGWSVEDFGRYLIERETTPPAVDHGPMLEGETGKEYLHRVGYIGYPKSD